jgi:hypothetical protein
MTDLRTRIAWAITGAQFAFDNGDPYNGPENADALADAVIRELGLREESRGPVTAYRAGQYRDNQTLRRYVTQWTTAGGDPDA